MVFCKEVCPIAVPVERVEKEGAYSGNRPYKTLQIKLNDGVIVSALENDEYPAWVGKVEVPADASATCNVSERIARQKRHGGTSGATENCLYVQGKKVWVSITAS